MADAAFVEAVARYPFELEIYQIYQIYQSSAG